MKHRILITLLLMLSLFLGFGCNLHNSLSTKKPPEAQTPAPAMDHQGFHLTVLIDGQRTQQGDTEDGAQIWVAPKCSRVPFLQFSLDTLALGKIREDATLTIYPMHQSKVDLTDFFVYSGDKKLQPGSPIKLDQFTHFHDQTAEANLTALPAGQYRITLKALGDKENQWDRQYIDVNIE